MAATSGISSEVVSAPVRVEIPRGLCVLPEAACSCTFQLPTEAPTSWPANDLQRIQASSYMLTSSGNPLQEWKQLKWEYPFMFGKGLSYFHIKFNFPIEAAS